MSGRARRASAALLAGAFAVLAVAGCGVSTTDEPEPISRDNLPDVLDSESPTGVSIPTDPADNAQISIWLLRADGDDGDPRLYEVARQVPRPVGIEAAADSSLVLETLLREGPTPEENQEGVSTAIPRDARLTAPPRQEEAVLVVNLSDDFFQLRGETGTNAVAQLVYTATSIPGVEQVQFQLDGEPVSVRNGDGESVERPVRREDYENLDPAASGRSDS